MKTAISIPDHLFKEIEKIAKDQHYSRSEVFTRAVEEYVEKRRSRQLLDALNEAYAAAESPEEYAVREKSKRRYRRTVLKERR
jgi:metal-responsive CopG/Arc/MetJ family transcriptional regulator